MLKILYQQWKVMKTKTGLTKKVVKNYFPKFCALIIRWAIFCCEPVLALLRFQEVVQPLINGRALFLDIIVPGLNKALGVARGFLSKPERMLETDEDD